MTIEEKLRAKLVIREVARRENKSPAAARAAMQEALDEAWEQSLKDPEGAAVWRGYFPDGKKPSLDEFIVRMAKLL